MKRRQFISLLGGAATAWPGIARAQQPKQMKRVGVLVAYQDGDATAQNRIATFRQGLRDLGWEEGQDIQIDYRWNAHNTERASVYAAELVRLAPDAIICASNASVRALQHATSTIPIIFLGIADPIGAGFVASLARPGGNITGFTPFEHSMAGKWLELLREMAPNLRKIAVIQNPTNTAWASNFETIKSAAPLFAIEPIAAPVHNADEIEHTISEFALGSNGGLIVLSSPTTMVDRKLIVALAQQHRLPAIYTYRDFVMIGGLISYGPYFGDEYRQAASYVDRILKGEKPQELPVQAPVRFEMVINLKTARALGLVVPVTVLVRADEVIE